MDNPEEIQKQKAIKAFLNKVTPENFDKMLANIVAVGYETEATESGLIDQVLASSPTPLPPPHPHPFPTPSFYHILHDESHTWTEPYLASPGHCCGGCW